MAYNFNNPWAKNRWAENIWAKPEMMDKALGKNAQTTNLDEKPTTGIFVENVTKNQLEILAKKINLATKALNVEIPLNTLNVWADENNNNGCLHCTHEFTANDAISTAFAYIFSNQVLFINKEYDEVPNYDVFMGPSGQWVNIDQLNKTRQKEFFIYALTHPAREFLYAKERNYTEYFDAHNPTLAQDLEIFNQFCWLLTNNPNFNWLGNLRKSNYINSNTKYTDGDSKTEIKADGVLIFKYPAVTSNNIAKFTVFSLYNVNKPGDFINITVL